MGREAVEQVDPMVNRTVELDKPLCSESIRLYNSRILPCAKSSNSGHDMGTGEIQHQQASGGQATTQQRTKGEWIDAIVEDYSMRFETLAANDASLQLGRAHSLNEKKSECIAYILRFRLLPFVIYDIQMAHDLIAAKIVPPQHPLESHVGKHHIIDQGQCLAICKTRSMEQCSNRTTTTWPYCRLHLSVYCGLDVQPSQHVSTKSGDGIGLGLFATKRFERGDFVSYYSGDVLRWSNLDQRYPEEQRQCPFLFEFDKKYCIDARSTHSHVARYINDYRDVRPKASENCLFENLLVTRSLALSGCEISKFAIRNKMIVVRATQTVIPGQEFFATYGEAYVFDDSNRTRTLCPSESLTATETDEDESVSQQTVPADAVSQTEATNDPEFVLSETSGEESLELANEEDEEEEDIENEEEDVDNEPVEDEDEEYQTEDDVENDVEDDESENDDSNAESRPVAQTARTFDDPMDVDYEPGSDSE